MKFRSPALVIAAVIVICAAAFSDDKSANTPPKMDEHTRLELIRAINAEIVYMRRPLPMGGKGITIKDGVVTPGEKQVQDMIALYGPSVKAGDQARITNIQFKGDNKIIFEINGGPQKKKKWYQHIQVGGASGSVPLDPSQDDNVNARGSMVTLEFDKYVPQIGPQELKKMLAPVFNFDAKSPVEAYLDTVPPKVKDAIKNKQVLVGMNREMVMYSLGRPPKKYRQDNYEEWIYGNPPDPVQFVRFVGDEVVRLEIMKVDGEKLVRTEKEVDLKEAVAQAQPASGQVAPGQGTSADAQQGTSKRPSLRRPGEAAPDPQLGGKPPDNQQGPVVPVGPGRPGMPPGTPGVPPGTPGVPQGPPGTLPPGV
jgi:outer membrane protein assembly factor BamE (lipoprotein component of BamABCDE complex)